MKTRKSGLAVLLVGLVAQALVSSPVWSQSRTIEVRYMGSQPVETDSGKQMSVVFSVRNSDSISHEYVSTLELPSGWKTIIDDFPFALNARESKARIMSLLVPRSARAGVYFVMYTVSQKDNAVEAQSFLVEIVVTPVKRVSIRLLEVQNMVMAGDEYTAVFSVANEGNTALTLEYEATSSLGFANTIFGESATYLEAGESRDVEVAVETEERSERVLRDQLDLEVTAIDDRDITAQASCDVEIIPRAQPAIVPFHTIPFLIDMVQIVDITKTWKADTEFRISGAGTIDEAKDHKIELFAEQKSGVGWPDRYKLSLKSDWYELYTGDHSFGLTPLTKSKTLGKGLEGSYLHPNMQIGGFINTTQDYDLSQITTGGRIETNTRFDYPAKNRYELGAHFLNTIGDAYLGSITAAAKPIGDFVDAEMEFAYGMDSAGNQGLAYSVSAKGSYDWIQGSLRHSYADQAYPGARSDERTVSSIINVKLLENTLSLSAIADWKERGLASYQVPSTEMESAQTLIGLQSSVGYTLPRLDTGLSLGWQRNYDFDRVAPPDFHREVDEITADIRQPIENGKLNFTGEVIHNRDMMDSSFYINQSYRLSLDYQPTEMTNLGGRIEFDVRNDLSTEPTFVMKWGLMSSFSLGRNTSIDFDLSNSNVFRQSYTSYDFAVGIWLDHTFPNQNRFAIGGDFSLGFSGLSMTPEIAFVLEYQSPFRIQVTPKKNIAFVSGRVFSEHTQRGIPDIIVRLDGLAAVTDENGDFNLPPVKPGSYYLSIDQTGLGPNQIPVQRMPLEIAVAEGETEEVSIGVIEGASVFGVVKRYDFAQEDRKFMLQRPQQKDSEEADEEEEYKEGPGLPNVLVEITNGTTTKRRITDHQGRFRFADLTPGVWTVNVKSSQLPEYHYFEKESFTFDLLRGEDRDFVVRVLPKRRTLMLIQSGGVIKTK